MPSRPEHSFQFAQEVIEHLDAIERKYHRVLEEAIDEQLTYTPAERTRNRKPLEKPGPFGATWELRCGPDNRFRVFYDVDSEDRIVSVLAIGLKETNRLWIAGEEYKPS